MRKALLLSIAIFCGCGSSSSFFDRSEVREGVNYNAVELNTREVVRFTSAQFHAQDSTIQGWTLRGEQATIPLHDVRSVFADTPKNDKLLFDIILVVAAVALAPLAFSQMPRIG
jgi:hypothetical protein